MNDDFKGFDELTELLEEYAAEADEERVMKTLEYGAEELVKILKKLPKPYSQIHTPGYTHLVNTFIYQQNNKQVDVGWGKYYGKMVENGTTKMRAYPHLNPAWEKNKELIYNKMLSSTAWKG